MIVYTATGERLTIKDVPFSKGGEGAVRDFIEWIIGE